MSRSIKCKVSSSYSVQCGIISIDDISKMLSHFERLAKNYLGLTDEEFEKRTSAVKGIIYAIHKR